MSPQGCKSGPFPYTVRVAAKSDRVNLINKVDMYRFGNRPGLHVDRRHRVDGHPVRDAHPQLPGAGGELREGVKSRFLYSEFSGKEDSQT